MLDLSTLAVFMTASVVLLVTPGPAVLYIVARSIDQGWRAGVISAVGAGTGTLVHIAAAAAGLSALLVSSALAFSVVKYLGAAYLVYLGIKTLLSRDELPVDDDTGSGDGRTLREVYRQGVIVQVLNPKTALFIFAFLPQFVDPARGSVALQIVLLGAILMTMGIVSDSAYALAAGTVRGVLRRSIQVVRAQRYFSGSVYIALGLVTAFSSGGQASTSSG